MQPPKGPAPSASSSTSMSTDHVPPVTTNSSSPHGLTPPSADGPTSSLDRDDGVRNGDLVAIKSQTSPHTVTTTTTTTKKPTLTARLTRMFSQNRPVVIRGADGTSDASSAPRADDLVAQDLDLDGGSAGEKKPASSHSKTREHDPAPGPWKRFELRPDGAHEHHLKGVKRQEKLSDMLRDLIGGKRREEHAVGGDEPQLSLMSGWVDQVRHERDKQASTGAAEAGAAEAGAGAGAGATATSEVGPTAAAKKGGSNATPSLAEKYGRCQEVVGRGAFGVVRVAHKPDPHDGRTERLFAVKEFRRRPGEAPKRYQKRLTSEFCISASLRHPNVIHTLDLLQDAKGDYCEVMEFCAGGDLYSLVLSAGKLDVAEADCFFKQLMRGVEYMHEMGVAHRDLKPENLLLTTRGALKITDFGNGECFRMAWETDARMTAGLCGSAPYIAPEEYVAQEFDPRAVDVWATGVIYMAMRTGRHLWTTARDDPEAGDDFYHRYLLGRRDEAGYAPIESLHRARCRNVIYSILDPNPRRRITASQVLKSEWGREIKLCRAGEEGI